MFNKIKNRNILTTAAAVVTGLILTVSAPSTPHAQSAQSALMAAGAERGEAHSFGPNYAAVAIAVRHWSKRTLTVHITPSDTDGKTTGEIAELAQSSLSLWNDKVGEQVKLELTDAANADVQVTFVQPGTLKHGAIGLTNVQFDPEDQTIGHADIQLNARLGKSEFVQVLAHETGHALGIEGHSDDKHDLMYPFAHLPAQITDRDLNTFHVGYNLANNNTSGTVTQE